MDETFNAKGRFSFSLTQVPCTPCTETTSREQRRMRGESRFPQPRAVRPSLFPDMFLIKEFCRKLASLLFTWGRAE